MGAAPVRSALVVGAGAIGAAVASRLHDSDPASVFLCASGERKARYERDGFIVNGSRYRFRIAEPAQAPFDLVIFAVKDYDPDSTAVYDNLGDPMLAIVICWDYEPATKFWASRIVFYATPLAS